MIRFSSSTLSKRLTINSPVSWVAPALSSRRSLHSVSLQLDYYMSAQFAGCATALVNNMYEKAGLDLKFLPICPVGLELERVRINSNANGASCVTIGSVEQNIFIPTLYNDPSLKLKGVAAMFRRSPLCLASLAEASNNNLVGENKTTVVGAHEDTVSLILRILSASNGVDEDFKVIASPRASKNSDLLASKLSAIQAYVTTEVPTLDRELGGDGTNSEGKVIVAPLEGMNGAKLGYSQLLFAPEEDLKSNDKREIVQTFLDVTFKGWEMSIRDNEAAASSVEEAKAMLKLDDENNDHWGPSHSYTVQNVGLCCDFVKETYQGDRYGVINPERFNQATEWLLDDNTSPETNFGLDPTVWQPSPKLIAGGELGRKTLEEAKESAALFLEKQGRKPKLAIITIGELNRYKDGERRRDLYSNTNQSWFSRETAGQANGFDVEDIVLPKETTTDDLLDQIYTQSRTCDGIQLMWPLPDHIDASKCYNAIDISQDVDGAHFLGQSMLDPKNASPIAPVAPTAVLALIDEYGIEVANKFALVIGRSKIVGAPLAHMLNRRGAIVTVAHSEVSSDNLKTLVENADLVFATVGSPGLLKAEWIKPGAEVINVGTTFDKKLDMLCSDFEGDIGAFASRYSPVPGSVGPLNSPFLFKNVMEAAWKRAETTGEVEKYWTKKSSTLQRAIHFKDYTTALDFAGKVNTMSNKIDHHANMTFTHECVSGVNVTLELFTYDAGKVTEEDYNAAKLINDIASEYL